jgi:hypothetical protein
MMNGKLFEYLRAVFDVEFEPTKSQTYEELAQFAHALGINCDSWVTISFALTDLITEMPSAERGEVGIAV